MRFGGDAAVIADHLDSQLVGAEVNTVAATESGSAHRSESWREDVADAMSIEARADLEIVISIEPDPYGDSRTGLARNLDANVVVDSPGNPLLTESQACTEPDRCD